jgi:hypothetical protein
VDRLCLRKLRTAQCAAKLIIDERLAFLLVLTTTALAEDKNGVSPQVISLPSGPGSVEGLGEAYQPQLNTGSVTLSIPIKVPMGAAGHAPQLSLQYNSGAGNGPVGIGWSLNSPSISRNIDRGLPRYVDCGEWHG